MVLTVIKFKDCLIFDLLRYFADKCIAPKSKTKNVKEMMGLVSQMRRMDQDRLKEMFSAIRKFLAVYEKPAKKVP